MKLEERLQQLQQQLAFVDLLTESRARRSEDTLELLLMKLGPLKVKMYQEVGHHVPHVHIDYGRKSHVASYSILDGERFEGTLHPKYDRVINAWIAANRSNLLQAWQTLRSGADPAVLIGELSP